ncbi:hypothetical protein A8B78_08285 [Jannaschia sp. EhC01]|nr:hypothetical protein A8B78_08285 [Jannaschia sp. EhC01]
MWYYRQYKRMEKRTAELSNASAIAHPAVIVFCLIIPLCIAVPCANVVVDQNISTITNLELGLIFAALIGAFAYIIICKQLDKTEQ